MPLLGTCQSVLNIVANSEDNIYLTLSIALITNYPTIPTKPY